jgi:hypothetical protein
LIVSIEHTLGKMEIGKCVRKNGRLTAREILVQKIKDSNMNCESKPEFVEGIWNMYRSREIEEGIVGLWK